MTIIVLTNCPPKLRGDMTKWMAEINTGVFVGKISARVREELWKRICENIKSGQATMVYPADGEQHIDFRVHNTTWEVVDFDGIKLMRRPSPETIEKMEQPILENGFSKAAKNRLISNVQKASRKFNVPDSFVVLDIETTGLDIRKDQIIEIAGIKYENQEISARFSSLVSISEKIPQKIIDLTGITDEMIANEGKPLKTVLAELIDFIDGSPIVCHNAAFDISFLQNNLRNLGLPPLKNKIIDTLPLARKKIDDISGYKLSDIAKYLELDTNILHRALPDCQLTLDIFLRLNQS